MLGFIIIVLILHLWGTRKNKRKAKAWINAHGPILQHEFARVGYEGRKSPSIEDVESTGLAKAMASDSTAVPEDLLKEASPQEYKTYASGRQNVAYLDVKLSLFKRYNPLLLIGESILSLFFESIPAPKESMHATIVTFDGKEKELMASLIGEDGAAQRTKGTNSSYDGFVWAVVHKDSMKQLRDDRYDVSLTYTKDHPKLPAWATVMSESAEVTETLLTPELIKAVEQAGDALEALIVSDQPVDKPRT